MKLALTLFASLVLPGALGRAQEDGLVTFEASYLAGQYDANGEWMGGTELMRLVAHEDALYAGLSYWTDQPGDDPRSGAQILVKRGPNIEWEVDRSFPGVLRISALEPITFATDSRGEPLHEPVTLLLADAAPTTVRNGGPLAAWVRDDAMGEWVETQIAPDAPRAFIRAFGIHHDAVNGVDLVFAGTGAGEVYSGAYDPDAPGRIRWSPEPEYANPDFDGGAFKRCQGFCVANERAYASVAPRLLERQDGPKPVWREVWRWYPEERAGAGLRGITAIPVPDGHHEVILGSREQEGRILRIDPLDDYAVELELESHMFLEEQWRRRRAGKLVAYNRFVPGEHPRTGEPIHWVSMAAIRPGDRHAAWLMIRHLDGTYETVRVFDPDLQDPPMLISTRTVEYAPWDDREIYTGGYDGAANNRANHNTAWIYRGTLMPAEEAAE